MAGIRDGDARQTGFATLAIHAGAQADSAMRARAMPVRQVRSPVFDDVDHAAAQWGLRKRDALPARAPEPAAALLEERIAALEGGTAALAVASGQAARSGVFHALLQPGDEFVAARSLSPRSIRQFSHAFRAFGWQVRWADGDKLESFVEALSDRTKAIFVESIADPGGTVTDIAEIAAIARRARLPLVVDNTLATPYLMRPFEHGADIVVHSATRLLSGHAASSGGLIVDGGSFVWAGDARYPALSQPSESDGNLVIAETFGNFAFAVACRALGVHEPGASMAPFDAVMILSGVETLSLRMQRHCDNALVVARHLAGHPKIGWVTYAGLATDPGHALAQRYCATGAGGSFSFGVAGRNAGLALVDRLKLFSHLADIGDTRSLAVHPASTTQSRLADERELAADHQTLSADDELDVVRVSIGLEDAADIIADLDQALAGI